MQPLHHFSHLPERNLRVKALSPVLTDCITLTSDRNLILPNTVAIDGVALVDAQASWDFGPAQLSLSIVNLMDKNGFEPYQYFAGPYVVPTQPRSAFTFADSQGRRRNLFTTNPSAI